MDKCSKTNLNRSCLFNGIIFRKAKSQINDKISEGKPRLSKSLVESAFFKMFNEPTLSLEEGDILICYINPAVKSTTTQENFEECCTYLEIKSQI